MEVRTNVPYCSSCFQAKPGTAHVDFDAAWDGPVLQDAIGAPIGNTIDELVICEDCLKTAGSLIGLSTSDDREKLDAMAKDLLQSRQDLRVANEKLAEIRQNLGVAAPQPAPAPEIPKKRGPGRPRKHPLPA